LRARTTEDETTSVEVMHQILGYNRERLEATCVLLKWLRSKKP